MKKLLIGTLLILTACGSTPAPTPPPSAFNVSGGWTGTLNYPDQTPLPLNLQLVQATGSDDITGTAFNAIGTGTVAGKLSTGVLIIKSNADTMATFTGSFTATTYKGTITTASLTGTFSFTKNQ